jgi:protein-tyrosine phosphatase
MSSNDPRLAWAKQLHSYLHPLATKNAFRTPVTQIEPGLFLGGKPQPNFPKVDAVLNVSDTEYQEPEVTSFTDNAHGDFHCWMPIYDRAPFPGIQWLDLATSIVDNCRQADFTTFVHCDAGMSRSAMVMIAYIMKRDKLSVDDAIDYVLKKRAISPNEYFLVGLMDWEDFLKSQPTQEQG